MFPPKPSEWLEGLDEFRFFFNKRTHTRTQRRWTNHLSPRVSFFSDSDTHTVYSRGLGLLGPVSRRRANDYDGRLLRPGCFSLCVCCAHKPVAVGILVDYSHYIQYSYRATREDRYLPRTGRYRLCYPRCKVREMINRENVILTVHQIWLFFKNRFTTLSVEAMIQ